MYSSSPVPWFNRPSRPFPAKEWQEKRYLFHASPAVLAPQAGAPAPANGPRRFPALVWQEKQQEAALPISQQGNRLR